MRAKNVLLALIFVLALAARLYFSLQSGTFTLDSYFDYRQVQHIRETGLPAFDDKLSYGGREFLFLPAFHYILAFFSFFMPFEAALTVMPCVFSASVVFIVYVFVKKITKNEAISLFSSLASAFIPIHFVSNISSVSSLSLQIPLLFAGLYCFLMSNRNAYMILFVVLTFFLTLVEGSSILLILAFILYLSLGKISGFSVEKRSIELILFYMFIVLWIILIFFKNAFLAHGFSVIWQNIPFVIRNQYFVRTTIFETVLSIGLLPIVSGAFACYLYVLRIKDKTFYLLLSLAISVLVLIWSRLITPIIGLSILGIVLVIFSGALLNLFLKYIRKTKFSKLKNLSAAAFAVVFILNLLTLSILFSLNPVTLSQQDLDALRFMAAQEKGAILAPVELGHAITAVADQPNIADTSFLLADNAEQRVSDIRTVYTTPFALTAIKIMDKYNAKYLYVPKNTEIQYIDERCFEEVYSGQVKVYRIICEVKEADKK
jgi:hypothetical protein